MAYNDMRERDHITLPYLADDELINSLVNQHYVPGGK